VKRSTKSIIFALVLIAAILLFCVFAVIQNAMAPLEQREDKTVHTPKENVVIQAATFNGDIEIRSTTGSQIEVMYNVTAPNGFLKDIKTFTNETKSDNLTTIITSAELQVNQGVNYKANLIVNLPNNSRYNLTLTTPNGNIDIQGSNSNEINAMTANGNVNIDLSQNTLFQVTASTVNGNITHQGITLDASTETSTRLNGATSAGEGNLILALMSGKGNIAIEYVMP
jgi:cytoskeletal protein RodZ